MIGLAVLGLAASVYGFLLTAANMLGVSIGFVDRATVEMLLGESNLGWALIARIIALRSEEHTSELRSLMRPSYAVFRLKKKTAHKRTRTSMTSSNPDTYTNPSTPTQKP